MHPHQLRHSYATHIINNGAPIEVIQSLFGHEKSEMTKSNYESPHVSKVRLNARITKVRSGFLIWSRRRRRTMEGVNVS
ncbi:tyrosine-type recombinase/integrase [Lysinibacillus xylanilyticus]|uniref:Tyrosine-type recombinase/integrase n=1 Tax=Lysinibacillus xylanilyticus TaxID=582475 RepID=A0ABV3VR11_9BACI